MDSCGLAWIIVGYRGFSWIAIDSNGLCIIVDYGLWICNEFASHFGTLFRDYLCTEIASKFGPCLEGSLLR